jgi:hypothetical protein
MALSDFCPPNEADEHVAKTSHQSIERKLRVKWSQFHHAACSTHHIGVTNPPLKLCRSRVGMKPRWTTSREVSAWRS